MAYKKSSPKSQTRMFTNCFFCDGEIYTAYHRLKDRLETTTEAFTISECTSCKAAFLNPQPVGDAAKFYPEFYLSSEVTARGIQKFDFEKWYRNNQYKYDFKFLKRATGQQLVTVDSYIDIGCGSGERVIFAKKQGCPKTLGLDKFDFAKYRSRRDIKIVNTDILDYRPDKKFQVGSLFHVLEHVENPREILAHIRSNILTKEGIIIIQVPNYGSWERQIFGSKWFGFDTPRHLWHFNEQTLTAMLQQAGYTIAGSYQTNAPLHPVTLVPSIYRELDVQRIWVKHSHRKLFKTVMMLSWASLTLLAVPLTIIQNLFKKSSMLTIVAVNNINT